MSLPYYKDYGWDSYVLAVHPDFDGGIREPLLEQTVPASIKIIRTKALPVKRTGRIGLGDLGLRCLPYMRSAGDKLLAGEKIDLIYFSTTAFSVMALGPWWHKKFGVPFVLDFQDPWLNDSYRGRKDVKPPGGTFKYGCSQALARILEPHAVRQASHIISVSPSYVEMLRQRYAGLSEDKFTVLPFGASENDFEILNSLNIKQSIFDPNDGKRHLVYVGAVSGSMLFAVQILFRAISEDRLLNPEKWIPVKLHFVGSNYVADKSAAKTVEPIAHQFGLADCVDEHPQRIPYFEALQVLADSHGILMIGSDEPGYTASKLYTSILARKPILALFHEQSAVVDALRRCRAGRVVTFNPQNNQAGLVEAVKAELNWLLSLPEDYRPEINWPEFQPFTAREMTRQQCAVFDQCLTSSGESLYE